MNTSDLIVPDIGDFKNVEVIEVHVRAGDSVQQEAPLITLESEKKETMDIPSPAAGKLVEFAVKKGDRVSAGTKMGIIESSPAGNEQKAKPESTANTDLHAEVLVLGA